MRRVTSPSEVQPGDFVRFVDPSPHTRLKTATYRIEPDGSATLVYPWTSTARNKHIYAGKWYAFIGVFEAYILEEGDEDYDTALRDYTVLALSGGLIP